MELEHMLQRLHKDMAEVIRISDREHGAWHRAKESMQALGEWLAKCGHNGKRPLGNIEQCAEYNAAPAVTAQPVAIPAGHKLVPVEPTEEMLDAAQRHLLDTAGNMKLWLGTEKLDATEAATGYYRAMLNAAPPTPTASAGEPEPVLTVEREPDYWSGGHFHEGRKPHIDPTKVWALPIGTKLYTHPTPSPAAQPVAMRYDFDGYGYRYIDNGSGSDWQERHADAEPLFTRPSHVPMTEDEAEALARGKSSHLELIRAVEAHYGIKEGS